MKVLNLLIKQKYFDAIMQGREVQEFREIRPNTAEKLVEVDDEGYFVIDEDHNIVPIKYDAIRFFVGYNKDRDSALVEVESAYSEVFMQVLRDESGKPMQFEADEDGNILYFATENDQFVKDENGNFIVTDATHGEPMRIWDGREGAEYQIPITYDYNGGVWVASQIVYNLGKILEKSVKPKIRK